MEIDKERLLVEGLHLQGQEQLLLQLIKCPDKFDDSKLTELYFDVYGRLNEIKDMLRRGSHDNFSELPLTVSEFEETDLVKQDFTSDADKTARTLHYKIKTSYDQLVESVSELRRFGVNTVVLNTILQTFALQMIRVISYLERAVDRKESVENVLKDLKEKKDDREKS